MSDLTTGFRNLDFIPENIGLIVSFGFSVSLRFNEMKNRLGSIQ